MRDPFNAPANAQLYREAQVGLGILACLMVIFVYLVIQRISGSGLEIPEHVRQAPVAKVVQPDGSPRGYTEAYRSDELTMAAVRPSEQMVATQTAGPTPEEFLTPGPDDEGDSFDSSALATGSVGNAEQGTELPVADKMASPRISVPELSLPPIEGFPARDLAQAKQDASSELVDSVPTSDNGFEVGISKASVPPRPFLPTELEAAPMPDIEENGFARTESLEAIDERAIPGGMAQAFPVNSQPNMISPSPDFQTVPEQKTELVVQAESSPQNSIQAVSMETAEPAIVATAPPVAGPTEEVSIPQTSLQIDRDNERQLNPGIAQHRRAEGDSFYSIAQQYYGDGAWFRALHAFNRDSESADRDTDIVEIPSIELLQERYPSMSPVLDSPVLVTEAVLEHQVQYGETLFGIARDQLGQASRYLEILEANRDRLGSRITASTPLPVGLRLTLPR